MGTRSRGGIDPRVFAALLVVAVIGAGVGLGVRALVSSRGAPAPPEIVLYSSADPAHAKVIIDAFEAETGVKVRLLGDTEATKTTGLVNRLLNEGENPKADVWWSSEPFGTIRLAEAGALAPMDEELIPADWPAEFVGPERRWAGFASRARMFVYSTDAISPGEASSVITSMYSLTESRFKDKVGIAQPAFGTTRGHVGAMLAGWGEAKYAEWLAAMEANGARLYDGNMTVVRAVGQGSIDVGLTDTDDILAGQANGWPVEGLRAGLLATGDGSAIDHAGAVLFPNTIGLVAGRPYSDPARAFVRFVLSARGERMLAEATGAHEPVYRATGSQEESAPAPIDLPAAAAAMSRAVEMADDALR